MPNAANDEIAIAEASRLIAEADEQVIAGLIRGVDTIEAERLVGKMRALANVLRQTAKDRPPGS